LTGNHACGYVMLWQHFFNDLSYSDNKFCYLLSKA